MISGSIKTHHTFHQGLLLKSFTPAADNTSQVKQMRDYLIQIEIDNPSIWNIISQWNGNEMDTKSVPSH